MLELVRAVLVELAGGGIQRDRDVLARAQARGLDARDEHLQRLLVGAQVGSEAALVADGGRQAALVQGALERVEDLRAHLQAAREALGAARDDHELLEVDLVVGVHAAVEHVHHRHRQHAGVGAAEIAPQRLRRAPPRRRGRSPARRRGSRWRRGATCWGSRRARSGRGREPAWSSASRPRTAAAISPSTFATARVTPFPAPGLAAVAQLGGLELARRGAGGDRRAAARARGEHDVHLDRRVASAVEDLTGVDLLDRAHLGPFVGYRWPAGGGVSLRCSSCAAQCAPCWSSWALCTACSWRPRSRCCSPFSPATSF